MSGRVGLGPATSGNEEKESHERFCRVVIARSAASGSSGLHGKARAKLGRLHGKASAKLGRMIARSPPRGNQDGTAKMRADIGREGGLTTTGKARP